jgi:hypothetical protein
MQYRNETKSLPPAKFLTIAGNLLHNAIFKANRTEARRVFRDIEAGKVVPLTNLKLEDDSLVRFDLALDHRRYRGKMNFRNFRIGLGHLINNASKALETPDTLRIYQNPDNPRSIVFGVFSITSEGDKPSVLVLGADSSHAEAAVRLQLTYLDSVEFEENLADAGDTSAA